MCVSFASETQRPSGWSDIYKQMTSHNRNGSISIPVPWHCIRQKWFQLCSHHDQAQKISMVKNKYKNVCCSLKN